jgi:hypothetical protein
MTSKSQYRTATDLWCSGLDIAPNWPVAAHRCRLAVSLPRSADPQWQDRSR